MEEQKQNKLFAVMANRKFGILVCAILCTVAVFVLLLGRGEEQPEQIEVAAVSEICELATLRCYYHDVVEYEKQPDGLFKYGFFQIGYKKFWLEYDGIVEIGIDVNQVQISEPDDDNIVRIYVPEAKVLDIDANENSMGDPVIETGVFTSVTTEEKAEAFAAAQAAMKENAQSDESILNQARKNAMELLERYVLQVNEKYQVEWIDEPA